MPINKTNLILFNGAAALLVGASLVYAVQSSFFPEGMEVCSGRYVKGTRMALESNGAPMGGADIQARFNGTDWGVLDRAQVVKLKSGPAPYAMEFDLTAAKADDKDESNGREGVGFVWSPREMGPGKAACLTYSAFLPEGFEFGLGGRLPGLMGVAADGEEPEQGVSQISTRLVWREAGVADIYAQFPGLPEGRSVGNDRNGFVLTRGQWMNIEQEVVLNAPGKKDGIVRVWIDGSLRYERQGLVLQSEKPAKLTGVLSEVVPMGADVSDKAKAQKIWISPYEIRWN